MKKKVTIIAIAALLIMSITPTTAFAHGHSRGSQTVTSSKQKYSLCNIDECEIEQIHLHDGTYYCGHSLNDGHDYHELCAVKNCTETGLHEHNGDYCFGHYLQDGHSYHSTTSSNSRGKCHR